jgi:hypothetical protein
MKPKDIVVGKKYRHIGAGMEPYVFLGCGKRVMNEFTTTNFESNFTDKYLVIIEDGETGHIGQIVKSPRNCSTNWWNGFEPVS